MPQASVGCASAMAMAVAFASMVALAAIIRRTLNGGSTRRAFFAALAGSSMGFSFVAGGVALYLSSPVWPGTVRIELYCAVFAGALVFAASAIALCKLRGALSMKTAACPGHGFVNLFAMALCAWLGYGFVTAQVQPFGLAALLATGALASAMGVHLTTSRAYRGNPVLANGTRGITAELIARIEWREGNECGWVLRDIASGSMRMASCRLRRATYHGNHRNGNHRTGGRNTAARSRMCTRLTPSVARRRT